MSARAPLDNITNSTWYNTSLSHSRVPDKNSSVCNPGPKNSMQKDTENITERHSVVQPSRPCKKKRINFNRRERRARERREGVEAFIREAHERSGDVSSSSVPDRLAQPSLLHSDPISAMRPAVYPPVTLEGRPTANDNLPFHFDQELGESAGLLPGLYKPAVPDPHHHTWDNSSAASSTRIGPPSPTRNLAATSAGDRTRTEIIYPFSHAASVLTSAYRWKQPCQSQQPFYAQTFIHLRVRLPQAFHAPPDDLIVNGGVIAL